MIALRDYQVDAIERCRREVARGRRRVVLVAPTGSGKTVIASAIVAGAAKKGRRTLFLAHRRELIGQAAAKLAEWGIDAGVILPGYPHRPEQLVQVASIQSLTARALRGSAIEMPEADVVVVDEAHHATAATYRAILAAYPTSANRFRVCRATAAALAANLPNVVRIDDATARYGMARRIVGLDASAAICAGPAAGASVWQRRGSAGLSS